MHVSLPRILGLGPIFLISSALFAVSQHQSPAGNRWPDNNSDTGFHVEAPPAQGAKSIDSVKLRADAAELRNLTAAVQSQAEQVTKGMIPKDMDDNLKKIEKLAKHLRNEINP